MTHWWAAPVILAAIALWWAASSPLYCALRDDRRWPWPAAFSMAVVPAIGALLALDLLAPQWGAGRKFIALWLCWSLLLWGEVIHEHRTGKPLISLPRRARRDTNPDPRAR